MNTKPIYNNQTGEQLGVSITGDYSSTSVEITLNQLKVEFDNDIDAAFHGIKAMQKTGLLPRMGSVARPLTARDFDLYRRNVELGRRHWRWIQKQGGLIHEQTGYDSIWGYGYYTDDGFVLCDPDDAIVFSVVTEDDNV